MVTFEGVFVQCCLCFVDVCYDTLQPGWMSYAETWNWSTKAVRNYKTYKTSLSYALTPDGGVSALFSGRSEFFQDMKGQSEVYRRCVA